MAGDRLCGHARSVLTSACGSSKPVDLSSNFSSVRALHHLLFIVDDFDNNVDNLS